MIPASINPTIIALRDSLGNVRATATNVAPVAELNVVIVDTPEAFEKAALGMPFNSNRVVAPRQPLNAAYRKNNP